MRRPAVSIVILCHKDREYVARCAASLKRHTRLPHELIFVDNASGDGVIRDLRRLRRTYPFPVRIIRNSSNRFFAGGNNQGIRAARGGHIVLLNADTLVTPGWLEGLLACARRPGVGLVGPYTNHAAGPQVLWPPRYRTTAELDAWVRRRVRSTAVLGRLGSGVAAAGRSRRARNRARPVPCLIGFCLLIPRRVVREVGLLDEGFGPGGFEDYDYCLRVRLAGYELAIAEDVYVHHFGGRGYVNMRYDALREGNREHYWSKWRERCRARLIDSDRRRREPSVRAR